ncbi:MAG: hypothetical protein ACYTXY_47660, partial [Nostoc sp.]
RLSGNIPSYNLGVPSSKLEVPSFEGDDAIALAYNANVSTDNAIALISQKIFCANYYWQQRQSKRIARLS